MARIKFTSYVEEDIVEEARQAAAYLAGHPLYLDLGQLVERALRKEIEALRKEFTQGAPFPAGRPKAGRPPGASPVARPRGRAK